MMVIWMATIIIAVIAGEWSMAVCCLIAMFFFVKGQAQ